MTAVEEASLHRGPGAAAEASATRRRRLVERQMERARERLAQLEREEAMLAAQAQAAQEERASRIARAALATPVAPDESPHVIRTVGGYISLPYAAELFGVNRGRLQTAAWKGLLPAVKSDVSRTAPWMVTLKDVARYLMDYPVHRRGGRPRGAPNKTPEERRLEAEMQGAVRAKYSPWHPSLQSQLAAGE